MGIVVKIIFSRNGLLKSRKINLYLCSPQRSVLTGHYSGPQLINTFKPRYIIICYSLSIYYLNGTFYCNLQKTRQMAVQVTQRAEKMLHNNHYNSELVRSIAENVTTRWQQLMFHAEERMKLILSSRNWFKTAEQVGRCLILFMILFFA